MPNNSDHIAIVSFQISDDQLEELVASVNEAFLDRRKAIAPKNNTDPNSGSPVKPEHFYWWVPGISEGNGSIYIKNKQIEKQDVIEKINATLSSLLTLRNNAGMIDRSSREQDEVRAANGEKRLRDFDGSLFTVQWFDDRVANELSHAFRSLTGQPATLGAYKRPSKNSLAAGQPVRPIKTPYSVFALFLIKIADLRRANNKEYTIGVLRKAMAPYWQANRLKKGGTAKTTEQGRGPHSTKQGGRPPKGFERWKLREEEPLALDACTEAELDAQEREVPDELVESDRADNAYKTAAKPGLAASDS